MMKLDDRSHAARLKLLVSPALLDAGGEALIERAHTIVDDAIFSIRDGSISGSGHIPSAPGEPPNADTHDLDESIHVGDLIVMENSVQTAVIADSAHALYMERGTSRILPRPFLTPAMEGNRLNVVRHVAAAISKFVGGRLT